MTKPCIDVIVLFLMPIDSPLNHNRAMAVVIALLLRSFPLLHLPTATPFVVNNVAVISVALSLFWKSSILHCIMT